MILVLYQMLGLFTSFWIGSGAEAGNYFGGDMEYVYLYKKALVASQAMALHVDGRAPFRTKTMIYKVPDVATGRIMGSLAGPGGLAGHGGLAGIKGGLVG